MVGTRAIPVCYFVIITTMVILSRKDFTRTFTLTQAPALNAQAKMC